MRAEQAPTVAVAEPAPSAWVRALTAWRRLRCWWGLALLLFAASVTMAGIGTRVNNPPWSTEDVHWGLDVFLFWIMLWWIAMLEGCQISIVGLQRHDPEIFKTKDERGERRHVCVSVSETDICKSEHLCVTRGQTQSIHAFTSCRCYP